MENIYKNKILDELVVECERKKLLNKNIEPIQIYNEWASHSRYKINDIVFVSWVLNYIRDVMLIDISLLSEMKECILTNHK